MGGLGAESQGPDALRSSAPTDAGSTSTAASAARTVPPPRRTAARREIAGQEPAWVTALSDQPPVGWREIVAVLLIVVLCDVTIYRGHGFAGYGLLFALGPLLLLFGAPKIHRPRTLAVLFVLLLLVAAKAVWCGSIGLVAAGFGLVLAFAVTLSGMVPYVVDCLAYLVHLPIACVVGVVHYCQHWPKTRTGNPVLWLAVLFPVVAVLVFGWLFVRANVELFEWLGAQISYWFTQLVDWIRKFGPTAPEIAFWLIAGGATVGLLRPLFRTSRLSLLTAYAEERKAPAGEAKPNALYWPYFNTLLAVVVLFAVYLVYEFATMWFRDDPVHGRYSDYAHEGAFWLTVALALATLLLSGIFRGRTLVDPRVGRLRLLAWIWSVENLVLAVCVYHRMWIYIEYNGMTRMRTVALFGITLVLVGFVLVVAKILYQRGFVWLIRWQLIAMALTVVLYTLTPVDWLVHGYNARRIQAGDPKPSVQIAYHPIDSQGYLTLLPALESDDPLIREGVAAKLAAKYLELGKTLDRRRALGWTSYQRADRLLYDFLTSHEASFAAYLGDRWQRQAAIDAFYEHSMQWF